MSFVSHYFGFLKALRVPAVLLATAAIAVFVFIYHDFSGLALQQPSVGMADRSASAWPELPPLKAFDWQLFCAGGDASQLGTDNDLVSRFRFAGIFFVSGSGGVEVRRAVLSVVSENRQVIASEGDEVAGVTVDRIGDDSVLLRQGDKTAELHLSFSGGVANGEAVSNGTAGISTNVPIARFGKVLAKNSWELNRSSLQDYYKELLDDPERLLKLFDSLKPLYNDSGNIEGYQLGIEGEREFFEAMGMQEGDVVRKVNSLPMTRRSRGEFFLKQVAANRISAIVIDVERNGKSERLVYQIR